MGANIKKTEYMEFYGLPGCGKSSLSHELAIKLRERGFDIYEPSYMMDHGHNRMARKIGKAICVVTLMVSHPVIFCRIVCRLYSYLKSFNDFVLMIINISYKLLVYLRQTKYDYVIFDEGIIQSAISIQMCENKDGAENWEYPLFEFLDNKLIVPIYVNTSIENSIRRMKERKDKDSRVEKISEVEEMKKMLLIYQTACNDISLKRTMILDGNQDKSDIVDILLGMFGEMR